MLVYLDYGIERPPVWTKVCMAAQVDTRVLSAAHCYDQLENQVRLAVVDASQACQAKVSRREVTGILPLGGDLVELQTSPSDTRTSTAKVEGPAVLVLRTDAGECVVDEVGVRLQTIEECRSSLPADLRGHLNMQTSSCAIDPSAEVCTGDSGAPLIAESLDGSTTAVALASWGPGCDANLPGVYVQIPNTPTSAHP